MEKEKAIQEFKEKLAGEGNLFAYTFDCDLPEDLTPEVFAEDMKDLFDCDPEKDILSKVYWWNDGPEEGWCRGAVLLYLRKEMTKEEACRLISAYLEEKKVECLNLMFNGADDSYDYIQCYDSEFAANEVYPLLISDGIEVMIDGENLWLGEETEPGFKSEE